MKPLSFLTFKEIMQSQILTTFGAENFPQPRNELIWKAVNDLPEANFRAIVHHFVGNKPIKYPPNVSDFMEAAMEQRKSLKAHETRQAANTLQTEAALKNEGLKAHLDKIGEKSLMDAIFKTKTDPEADRKAIQDYRKKHGVG